MHHTDPELGEDLVIESQERAMEKTTVETVTPEPTMWDAIAAARRVVRHLPPEDMPSCLSAIEAAEVWANARDAEAAALAAYRDACARDRTGAAAELAAVTAAEKEANAAGVMAGRAAHESCLSAGRTRGPNDWSAARYAREAAAAVARGSIKAAIGYAQSADCQRAYSKIGIGADVIAVDGQPVPEELDESWSWLAWDIIRSSRSYLLRGAAEMASLRSTPETVWTILVTGDGPPRHEKWVRGKQDWTGQYEPSQRLS